MLQNAVSDQGLHCLPPIKQFYRHQQVLKRTYSNLGQVQRDVVGFLILRVNTEGFFSVLNKTVCEMILIRSQSISIFCGGKKRTMKKSIAKKFTYLGYCCPIKTTKLKHMSFKDSRRNLFSPPYKYTALFHLSLMILQEVTGFIQC